MTLPPEAAPTALVVAVEEWFHDADLAEAVPEHQLRRLPPRAAVAVDRWLALLQRLAVRASFCVDPRVAEARTLAERIRDAGHEVVARGADAVVARAPFTSGTIATGAMLRRRGMPPSTPQALVVRSWEIDGEQPRLQVGAAIALQRHYDGLARTEGLVAEAARRLHLVALGEVAPAAIAGRSENAATQPAAAAVVSGRAVDAPAPGARTEVAVVVPLFDEADNLDVLLRSLADLQTEGADRYAFRFVLVDDGSRDATWAGIQSRCANRRDFVLVRHEQNRGIARAIRTGLEHADCEVVATVDADGTYDPLHLLAMLPLLDGADLVTASPYHPDGHVVGVPGWRLFLSRSLSRVYRIVLWRDLHTWTSCCRVARRSKLLALPQQHDGFLGVAETLVRLVRRGGVVVESPATLTTRLFGVSKMKTLRTIRGHLGLLSGLVSGRMR